MVYECLKALVVIMIFIVAVKAIIGYHFPWERCDCCGKKYRDHNKEGKL